MSILSRIEAGKVRAAAVQGTTALTPMSPEIIRWFSGMSAAGMPVNEDTLNNLAAAFACRRIIGESLGMLPWSMFEKDKNGNAVKAEDHPLQDVLVYSPNQDQTTVEFRESLAQGLTGDGNGYNYIDRLGKRITSLTPIFGVTPKRKLGSNTKLNLREGEVFFSFTDRGKPVDEPREKVWQTKGFGGDMLKGLSPLGAAREAAGGGLAMQSFANRFFSQGGQPGGTVTIPGWLKPEQKKSAEESLRKMVGGLGTAHMFALFEGGMKPEPWMGMDLEEMQFLSSRKFSVLEMARFYNMPPHMLGEIESGASKASIEQMSMEFLFRTLMPYITRIEASVGRWLLTPDERRKFMLRFNYAGLLRADAKGRGEMYASAVQNGWMERNEVRALENLNSVDGLGEFTVQSNLVPVKDLGKLVAAQIAPKPAPAQTAENSRALVLNFLPEQRPADVVVRSGDVTVTGGEQMSSALEHIARAFGRDDNQVAQALEKMSDAVDGLRRAQDESRQVALKLLEE